MRASLYSRLDRITYGIGRGLSRPGVLALFSVFALLAFWLGKPEVLFLLSFCLPGVLAIQALRSSAYGAKSSRLLDGKTGLPMRDSLVSALDYAMTAPEAQGLHTACLAIEIDDFDEITKRWGTGVRDRVLQDCADRLKTTIRSGDSIASIGEGRFAIVLKPILSAKLDIVMSVIGRLQAAIGAPIAISGATLHPSVSVGFATPRQADFDTASNVLDGALLALQEALRNGPGSVRGYSERVKSRSKQRNGLVDEVEEALTTRAIRPWFQPQISTDTGHISGFEALVRWHHPEEGLLLPPDFLEAVSHAGCMSRLGDMILTQSLQALAAWDAAGFNIPSVSVNFSAEELRDPTLSDRAKWEVDKFDMRPPRLTIEILETVAAQSEDDIILRNIKELAQNGFNLDLDDFGTGQSSIANIQRFRVNRIKIDRSFVTKMDEDSTQRAVVAGILALAERLGVGTVAEGVETQGEQSVLAQLGCDHLQGFGISRPMPFEDTITWIRNHTAQIARAPKIGKPAG